MAKKRKRKLKNISKLILFGIIVLFIFNVSNYINNKTGTENFIPSIINKEKEEKEKKYNECLKEKFNSSLLSDNLKELESEIDSYIITNNYQVSVLFEDLTTNFSYFYKPDTVYYGCSLIKLVDAIYLINKAINKEIDLDKETVTYLEKYKKGYSSGMAKRSIGEEISLRDLITYAISVSDNSAHLMLLDYIGFSNLKEYGENLGAKVILTGGDNFGSQTAEDMNIYLKEAYKIINENEEYGPFLKSIMDNNERNAFNTENIKIYHKYGSYDDNYHDVGLSLEEYPYTISILTLHENSGYKEIIQNIHQKIRNLQQEFYNERKAICQNRIYNS